MSAWKLPARRALQLVARVRLRLRSRPLARINRDSPTLVIAPHPDDEALGCAGLIASRRALGNSVHVMYVTDGSGSHPEHPTVTPRELARRRAEEAIEAMNLLGLEKSALHFVGAPDGRLSHLTAEERQSIIAEITRVLTDCAPSEIFIPGPDDGSTEHTACYELVQAALKAVSSPYREYTYPVWSWWNPMLLLRSMRKDAPVHRLSIGVNRPLKNRVLRCYRTQVEPLAPSPDPLLTTAFIESFDTPNEYFFEQATRR